MANIKDEMRRLWNEAFGDPDAWVEMFFSRVYRDDDVVSLTPSGADVPASMLLLQRYAMLFHGREVPVSYICGAATRRRERGRGYMRRLLALSLALSRERGDMLCSLIPARSSLYYYYAGSGFATVFYTRDLRFTAAHRFAGPEHYSPVADLKTPAFTSAFTRLERKIDGRVLHSPGDVMNILEDAALDGAFIAAVTDDLCGEIAAIGAARVVGGTAVVSDLLYDDAVSQLAVLRQLRAKAGAVPFRVRCRDSRALTGMTPRAMGRIVNVGMALDAIAAANPRLKLTVKVSDPILEANNGAWRIAAGHAEQLAAPPQRVDLDLPVDVFTRVVFSAPAIGEITGLPSLRPDIALMLD